MHISYYPQGNESMHAINQRQDIFIDEVDEKEIWRIGGGNRQVDMETYETIQPLLYKAIEQYRQGITHIMSRKPFVKINTFDN